jgi:hypothetical protein
MDLIFAYGNWSYCFLATIFGFQLFSEKIGFSTTGTIKFIEHTCLVSLEIYSMLYLIFIALQLVFYFGFIPTIILFASILCVIMDKDHIINAMGKNTIGEFILASSDFLRSVCIYLWPYIQNVVSYIFCLVFYIGFHSFNILMSLNTYLADNTKTKVIKSKSISFAYSIFMPMAMGYMLTPSNMPLDKPTKSTKSTKSFSFDKPIPKPNMPFTPSDSISSNMYKNIPNTSSDPMSFLKNTYVEDDVIDDDLDDDLDNCLDECLEELEKKDSDNVLPTPEPKIEPTVRTAEENKIALQNKIKQKRMARSGNRQGPQIVTSNGKHSRKNNTKLASQPSQSEMSNMMDMLMQKDNMETLMKEFPLDKNGQPNIDPAKLRKLMANMTKK